jgi:hypothetical protein
VEEAEGVEGVEGVELEEFLLLAIAMMSLAGLVWGVPGC